MSQHVRSISSKLESGVEETITKFMANVNILRIEVMVVNLKLLVKIRLPVVTIVPL